MNRTVAGLLGVALGIVTSLAAVPAAAQEGDAPAIVVNVSQWELDHLRSGTNRDGVEVVRGEDGDTITYTSVDNPESSSGDATIADPAMLPTPPDLSRVPVEATDEETTVAPPSGEPASAPVESALTEGVAGDATMSGPEGAATPLVAGCADFPSWYDAQIYYESVGGAGATPELVSSLDPDVDGVACEEIMQLS